MTRCTGSHRSTTRTTPGIPCQHPSLISTAPSLPSTRNIPLKRKKRNMNMSTQSQVRRWDLLRFCLTRVQVSPERTTRCSPSSPAQASPAATNFRASTLMGRPTVRYGTTARPMD
ncbi:hypothetical protein E2C01_052370 [Portunus trituberculatus]|uniref:Uncharacterized protein n=1 Tax=Portunus trituberculatus TaxID=210409 RepID=A0A5B7GMA3_PORTR|nr:hypothetical protein [Portunus trituberculatus]